MTQEPTPQTSTDGGGLRELIENQPVMARVLGIAIIVVLTAAVYLPAINGLFIWDDDHYVIQNTLLHNWEGLGRIWTDIVTVGPANYQLPQYYPLTHTSFWLEYQLGGHYGNGVPKPMVYHTTNVLLHIGNALLIWLLLTKLEVPGAWLAAAIFSLHPVQAETVTWISERKNVLSLFFFLSSLYVYLRYAGVISPPLEKDGKKPAWSLPDDPTRVYALAVVLFLCALWSKTITNSMPAVALVIIWWKRGLKLEDFKAALPLLAAGAGMGMLTGYMEHVRVGVSQRPQYWDYAPTTAGEIGARLIIAGRVVWFYVVTLLAPYSLSFNYERWAINPADVVWYLAPLLVIAVLAGLVVMSRKFGKGPAAAGLIFVGTLFPAMGFVNVWPMQYSFVADHFVYLSSIALIAPIAAILWKRLPLESFAGVAVCVILVMAGMTWKRSQVMSDSAALWEDTLQKNPRSWFAMNNYGVLVRDAGIIEDPQAAMDAAEKWFRKVITIKPDHPESRLNLAIIAERRGVIAQRAYLTASTQAAVGPGISIVSDPATTGPSTRMATTLPSPQALEQFNLAVRYYNDALRLQPNYVPAHFGLANVLRVMGKNEEALEHYRLTLEYYPRHQGALQVMADYANAIGDAPLAASYLRTLVDLQPNSADMHAEYGWALLRSGNIAGGFAEWEIAMAIAPADSGYANNFGIRMLEAGDFGRAFDYLRIANKIDPESLDIITNLGIVAARQGKPDVAKMLLNGALKKDPKFARAIQVLADVESGKLGPPSTQPTSQSSTMPTTQQREAISGAIRDLLNDPGAGGARPSPVPATAGNAPQ